MDFIERAIKMGVWFLVTFIWIFVGLFFWIPFLIRMIAVFSVAVLVHTFTDDDITAAKSGLEHGISFYLMGFKKINELVQDPNQGVRISNSKITYVRDHLWTIFWNTLYTFIFWMSCVGIWHYVFKYYLDHKG